MKLQRGIHAFLIVAVTAGCDQTKQESKALSSPTEPVVEPQPIEVKQPKEPQLSDQELAELITHGQQVALICQECHSLEAGEPNKLGPNLNGVIGRKAGTKNDFVYSEALANLEIIWNREDLNRFLKNPQRFAPGTAMPLRGLTKKRDRAAVIEYLAQLK